MKRALLALVLIVMVLSLANIACDDDLVEDIPRLGDGMGIGEKLEQTTCQATGGTWSNRTNTCK